MEINLKWVTCMWMVMEIKLEINYWGFDVVILHETKLHCYMHE